MHFRLLQHGQPKGIIQKVPPHEFVRRYFHSKLLRKSYSSVVNSFSSNRSSSEKSVSRISKSSSSSNPSSKNRSSSIDNSLFSLISRYFLIPVPAGICFPMITFSFRPTSGSIFPLIAASVSTFVVSWKDAADRKESDARDALVIPSSTCFPSAGSLPSAIRSFVGLVVIQEVYHVARKDSVSPFPRCGSSSASGER